MIAIERPASPIEIFIPNLTRICPACGQRQRYDYKSSGRGIRRLDADYWVEVQIVYCTNGQCPLVRKGMHPTEEWALAPRHERFGSDVIAKSGILHYGEMLNRDTIAARLWEEHQLKISGRTVNRLFGLYGALASGANLEDKDLIRKLRKQGVMVLSLDGAEPIKGREQVWFVREPGLGRTLVAKAMPSCTAVELAATLLAPLKEYSERIGVPIVGVVSDAEENVRDAVRQELPRVPHQLCQLHFVKNVAKPLLAEDRELRRDIKKNLRGVRPLEREIEKASAPGGELEAQQGEALLDVCAAVRSILKDSGEPPFKPPGLVLYKRLVELRNGLAEMAGKKGGPA